MLTYDVSVDGERIALAGIADWAVMSVSVSAVRSEDSDEVNYTLHIGGLSFDGEDGANHVRWKAPAISLGSDIRVRLLHCDEPDQPTKRFRSDGEVQENPFTDEEMREMRYQDYLSLKAEFEGANDCE